MTAVLGARDVAIDLPLPGGFLARRQLNILSGITLSVDKGETLALVGESGSGKTTLARAMIGLLPVSAGVLEFRGQPLSDPACRRRLRTEAAMLFQDARGSLSPRVSVGNAVIEPLAIHRRPRDRATAGRMLAKVGLAPEMAARFPHELSGGQARRVSVARALALDPALLVADEPTAGLDVSVQGEILNLLADLRRDLGLALVLISHNLAMVRHVSDRIAVLYLGRLVETGPTDQVLARPAHPYTQGLIAAEPNPDPRKRRDHPAITGEIPSLIARPRGCGFASRCPFAQDRCRAETPTLRPLAPGREAACHFAETMTSQPIRETIP
ncbi:MAG: ATP-binding cassette domain-containing protein [Rubellimicrobium sp.]|nr:ATP-binding cassette domain-containing protein [Rubellimicrobium sp.]